MQMLMQQKKSCDAMIDEKNKLINDFQLELKQKDDHYVKVSVGVRVRGQCWGQAQGRQTALLDDFNGL